jgi:hypothetical protein
VSAPDIVEMSAITLLMLTPPGPVAQADAISAENSSVVATPAIVKTRGQDRQAAWRSVSSPGRSTRTRPAPWIDPDQVVVAVIADRSVLGCMNDVAVIREVAIGESGGVAGTGIGELNRALRRDINRPVDTPRPVERAARWLRVRD